jgi:hypothetical protein
MRRVVDFNVEFGIRRLLGLWGRFWLGVGEMVITATCRRSWRIALPVAVIDLVRDGAQTLGDPQPFVIGERRPKLAKAADRAPKQQFN